MTLLLYISFSTTHISSPASPVSHCKILFVPPLFFTHLPCFHFPAVSSLLPPSHWMNPSCHSSRHLILLSPKKKRHIASVIVCLSHVFYLFFFFPCCLFTYHLHPTPQNHPHPSAALIPFPLLIAFYSPQGNGCASTGFWGIDVSTDTSLAICQVWSWV